MSIFPALGGKLLSITGSGVVGGVIDRCIKLITVELMLQDTIKFTLHGNSHFEVCLCGRGGGGGGSLQNLV